MTMKKIDGTDVLVIVCLIAVSIGVKGYVWDVPPDKVVEASSVNKSSITTTLATGMIYPQLTGKSTFVPAGPTMDLPWTDETKKMSSPTTTTLSKKEKVPGKAAKTAGDLDPYADTETEWYILPHSLHLDGRAGVEQVEYLVQAAKFSETGQIVEVLDVPLSRDVEADLFSKDGGPQKCFDRLMGQNEAVGVIMAPFKSMFGPAGPSQIIVGLVLYTKPNDK